MKRIFLALCFSLFTIISSFSQSWILHPERMNVVVYVPVDSLEKANEANHRVMRDFGPIGSYFDVRLKSDSMELLLSNGVSVFSQDKREEPTSFSLPFFYRRNKLHGEAADMTNIQINYLKLIEIDPDSLKAEYIGFAQKRRHCRKVKGTVSIPRSELAGIYIGHDKRTRQIDIARIVVLEAVFLGFVYFGN